MPDHVRVEPRHRRAQRGAAAADRRRHPRGVELVARRSRRPSPAGHRRPRHRPRVGRGARPARRRARDHDRHDRTRGRRPCRPIRCGCARSSTTCSRTPSPTTATAAPCSSARRATARRAGSWCATPASGIGDADRARLFQRFYKAGAARRAGHGARPRDHARHRPRARRRARPAQLARRRLDLHRQTPCARRRTSREGTALMILDLDYSVLVMTALVVNVSGILFIVETLLRRDEGAGRIWALAFLAAMLTTLAYIVWVQSPDGVVGHRGRQRRVRRAAPAACGSDAGDSTVGGWGGRRSSWRPRSPAAAIAVFVGGTGRRRLGGCAVDVHPAAGVRRRSGRSSACVVPCANRARRGCSRGAAVPVAVLPVAHDGVPHLRSRQRAVPERVRHDAHELPHGDADDRRGRRHVGAARVAGADARASAGLRATAIGARRHPLAGRLRRRDGAASASARSRRSELVGVIAVRIDDLEQISTAFGSEVARAVTETWRTRRAPARAVERARRRGRADGAAGRGARRVTPGGAAAGGGDLPRPVRRPRRASAGE